MKLRLLKRIPIAIALFLSIGAVARGQWPYVPVVQSNSNSQNLASITCVFKNNVTSGNYGMMLMGWFGTTNTPTISDTKGSTYTQKLITLPTPKK